MFPVIVTEDAERDIQSHYEWWRDNRSAEQALEWYEKILVEFQTLRHVPERCPQAPEATMLGRNLRQLLFTIGHRTTHRVIFLFELDTVTVVRVRHVAQDTLSGESITLPKTH